MRLCWLESHAAGSALGVRTSSTDLRRGRCLVLKLPLRREADVGAWRTTGSKSACPLRPGAMKPTMPGGDPVQVRCHVRRVPGGDQTRPHQIRPHQTSPDLTRAFDRSGCDFRGSLSCAPLLRQRGLPKTPIPAAARLLRMFGAARGAFPSLALSARSPCLWIMVQCSAVQYFAESCADAVQCCCADTVATRRLSVGLGSLGGTCY